MSTSIQHTDPWAHMSQIPK